MKLFFSSFFSSSSFFFPSAHVDSRNYVRWRSGVIAIKRMVALHGWLSLHSGQIPVVVVGSSMGLPACQATLVTGQTGRRCNCCLFFSSGRQMGLGAGHVMGLGWCCCCLMQRHPSFFTCVVARLVVFVEYGHLGRKYAYLGVSMANGAFHWLHGTATTGVYDETCRQPHRIRQRARRNTMQGPATDWTDGQSGCPT